MRRAENIKIEDTAMRFHIGEEMEEAITLIIHKELKGAIEQLFGKEKALKYKIYLDSKKMLEEL